MFSIGEITDYVQDSKKESRKRRYSLVDAKRIGDGLGIRWDKFDYEQFRMGLDVEFERGKRDRNTNVTIDESILTGKTVLAHLNENSEYYTRLMAMEKELLDNL